MPSAFSSKRWMPWSSLPAEEIISEGERHHHQSTYRLLADHDLTLKGSTAASGSSNATHPLFFRTYLYVLHGLLIAAFFWLWGQARFGPDSISVKGRSWSPANRFVEYEVDDRVVAIHGEHSVYAGPPSTEQEKAWDALVQPTYFNLSRDELERTGEPADRIVEAVAGGYMASLGVYHEIHCLRELRYWIYRDKYHPNITNAEARDIVGHLGQLLSPAIMPNLLTR
ncbi:hypothetical protein L249_8162 [Ophiocordyceps polyrhachis-furcata BCC 54312]|uniref:Uncharacterized protein n=1 Tax=Ophiocordyceps polyrhachis-furcata BCC 54312 TaxID=1330021 RepID=A0A367LHP4_9HYPO|nr:hypothetical protein L249_8162 [Ophiocordyceps polyrhachis-furcata BCC 54312]